MIYKPIYGNRFSLPSPLNHLLNLIQIQFAQITGSCILFSVAKQPTSHDQTLFVLGNSPQSREQLCAPWDADPLNAFIEWRRSKKAANTYPYSERSIEQHSAMWANFLKYIKDYGERIQTVQPDRIEAFLKQLRGRQIKTHDRSRLPLATGDTPMASHATVSRYTQLLFETFRHLAEIKFRRGNPVAPLEKTYTKPEAPPAVEFLNRDQEAALLDHIARMPVSDWKDQRDRTLLYLLLASGSTVGELVRLRIDDIQIGDYAPMIHLASHDLTHAHAAPVAPFAIEPLAGWRDRRLNALARYEEIQHQGALSQSDGSEIIPGSIFFPSTGLGAQLEPSVVYNIVRGALDAIQFPGKSRGPQTLRNTFARRQLFNNANPDDVTRWLGLVSEKTVTKILRTLPGTKASIVS